VTAAPRKNIQKNMMLTTALRVMNGWKVNVMIQPASIVFNDQNNLIKL
jgi:hypothetical protein